MESTAQRAEQETDLGQLLRALTLANATALLALGALMLYVVGVVRTIGLLHAEGVDTVRGVPLVPVQDYLLRGLGVVTDPGKVNGALGLVFTLLLLFAIPDDAWVEDDDEEEADQEKEKEKPKSTMRELLRSGATMVVEHPAATGGVAVVAIALLLTPLARWLPAVGAMAAIGVIVWVAGWLELLPRSPGAWGRTHRRVVFGVIVAVLAVTLLLVAYLTPPPIERVTIHTIAGQQYRGKLLALTDSLVYYLPAARTGHDPPIQAMPLDRVAGMSVVKGSPRHYRTIPQMLGLRLWHFDAHAGLHRDPPQ